MAHNYVLRVTAGHAYEPSNHQIVNVNAPEPMKIRDSHTDIALNVRIQNYHGLPRSSPKTNPYFDLPPYKTHQYSIAFSFTPTEDINGDDLVFGNDFDHPIRYRLPPGFGTAMKIVQWAVDPGLEADVYADEPWLYGRFLSSIDTLSLGKRNETAAEPEEEDPPVFDEKIGILVDEGGVGTGLKLREEQKIPAAAAARKKYFLTEKNRKEFVFEKGKEIRADFGNGYLDFNEFALRLPGFHLPIMSYWDGQPLRGQKKVIKRSHMLRYVLKNRKTGTVYMVVCFTLFLKEDVNEDGSLKEGVDPYKGKPPRDLEKKANEDVDDDEDEDSDDDDDFESAKGGSFKAAETNGTKKEDDGTNADDVD